MLRLSAKSSRPLIGWETHVHVRRLKAERDLLRFRVKFFSRVLNFLEPQSLHDFLQHFFFKKKFLSRLGRATSWRPFFLLSFFFCFSDVLIFCFVF